MKTIYILTMPLAVLLLGGCYGNNDNDSYKQAQEITVTGIEQVYNKTAYEDILEIDPKVTTTDPSDELEYEWSMYLYYADVESPPKNLEVTVIGTERKLEFPVDIKPQSYALQFKVTNRANQLEEYAVTRLNVVSDFSQGFYILKETADGTTELDLHNPGIKSIENLFGRALGEPVAEEPVSLAMLLKFPNLDRETAKSEPVTALALATSDNMYFLDTRDMTLISDHRTMFFYEDVPIESPLFAAYTYYGTAYFSNKGMYYTTYDYVWGGSPGTGLFGEVVPIADDYRPNVNIVANAYYTYFFDEINGRFLKTDYNGGLTSFTNDDSDGNIPADVPNGIDRQMLFFGRNAVVSTEHGYAVMSDKVTGNRYLYDITLGTSLKNPINWVRDLQGSGMNSATHYATNETQGNIIYFVKDNIPYFYRIDSGTEEVLELNNFGSGEQVTYISNRYWHGASGSTDNFDNLAIGTYLGGNYKIYFYNTVGGEPVGSPALVLEGRGKVLKVQYASPSFTASSGDNYPLSF